jgi:antitoxin (DNA-binding transcriptional repressor) of toxin-antitoxin stability system
MSTAPEINQRDLRLRSKEIMDAVEGGQTFAVTRDGTPIAELVPLRRRRQFVGRSQVAHTWRSAPAVDLARFRADQESAYDDAESDPYSR